MSNFRCARLASKTRVLPAEAVFGVDAPTEIELVPLLLYCPGAGVGAVRGECQASGCRAIRRFYVDWQKSPLPVIKKGLARVPAVAQIWDLAAGWAVTV